jgi:hypothetical protein
MSGALGKKTCVCRAGASGTHPRCLRAPSNLEQATVGGTVEPGDHVKILGVIMDTRLKYKEHIVRAASKGREAAMELRRLRGLSPATARQLFTSTVAPGVDYAVAIRQLR